MNQIISWILLQTQFVTCICFITITLLPTSSRLSSFTSLTILTNIQFLQTLANYFLAWILHKFTRIHYKTFRYAFLLRWILFLLYWISRYCDCQSLPCWQTMIWFTSIVKFFSSFSYYLTYLIYFTVSLFYLSFFWTLSFTFQFNLIPSFIELLRSL